MRTELTWLEEAGGARPVSAAATDAHLSFYRRIQRKCGCQLERRLKAEKLGAV